MTPLNKPTPTYEETGIRDNDNNPTEIADPETRVAVAARASE